MKVVISVVLTLGLVAAGVLLYIYSGAYNIGADAPHWSVTHQFIAILRDRSIDAHGADLQVPDLNDEKMILKGAGQYAAMCTGCHLAPGMKSSEIRPGLYPVPPNLSEVRIAPKIAFWAIKHGIKMSAMPAWGSTHDDATIWSMVAFLQKLPDLGATQYKEIVAQAPPDEDMDMSASDSAHPTSKERHYHQ